MRGILQLIQKNISMSELQSRCQSEIQRPGRILRQGVHYGPCLLVSRECGSEGSEIARAVGQRLGWEVFDKEIVNRVAQLTHSRRALIESVDEQVRSRWEDAWRPILIPGDLAAETYFQYLREVLFTLGHHGEVVILGRGAQHLLPSECALRLRVIAPLELRARRYAEENGVSLEQATVELKKCAARRADFIRKFFHADINSPLSYDLILNTGAFNSEAATELVLAALNAKLGVRPELTPEPAATV